MRRVANTSLPTGAVIGDHSEVVGSSHPTIVYAELDDRKWHHRHSARQTCQTGGGRARAVVKGPEGKLSASRGGRYKR